MVDDILLPADAVPEEARADTPDGKIIHSEIRIGTNDLMLADRLDGWPLRPGLLQVWVQDVGLVLDRATARGAEVVTEPTPFWGEATLGRMLDRWQNLWWLWAPAPGQAGPEYATDDSPDTVFDSIDRTLRAIREREGDHDPSR